MAYDPPSPFVFVVGSGYSPPSPFVFTVGDDNTSLTADGVVVQPVDTVSGVAVSPLAAACDFQPHADSFFGTATSPLVAIGTFQQPVDIVSGKQRYVAGDFQQPVDTVSGVAASVLVAFGDFYQQVDHINGTLLGVIVAQAAASLPLLDVYGSADPQIDASGAVVLPTPGISVVAELTGNFSTTDLPLIQCDSAGEAGNVVSGSTWINIKASGETKPFRYGIVSVSLPSLSASGFSGGISSAVGEMSMPVVGVDGEAVNPPMCAGAAVTPFMQNIGLAHVALVAQGAMDLRVMQMNAVADNPALVVGATTLTRLCLSGETVWSKWGAVSAVAPLIRCLGYAVAVAQPVSAAIVMDKFMAGGSAVTATSIHGVITVPKVSVSGNAATTQLGRSSVVLPRLLSNSYAHSGGSCEAACQLHTLCMRGIAGHDDGYITTLSFGHGCSGVLPAEDPIATSPLHYARCS